MDQVEISFIFTVAIDMKLGNVLEGKTVWMGKMFVSPELLLPYCVNASYPYPSTPNIIRGTLKKIVRRIICKIYVNNHVDCGIGKNIVDISDKAISSGK